MIGYKDVSDDSTSYTKDQLRTKYKTDDVKNAIENLKKTPGPTQSGVFSARTEKSMVKYWLGCVGYCLYASARLRTSTKNSKNDNRQYMYKLKLQSDIAILLPDFIG